MYSRICVFFVERGSEEQSLVGQILRSHRGNAGFQLLPSALDALSESKNGAAATGLSEARSSLSPNLIAQCLMTPLQVGDASPESTQPNEFTNALLEGLAPQLQERVLLSGLNKLISQGQFFTLAPGALALGDATGLTDPIAESTQKRLAPAPRALRFDAQGHSEKQNERGIVPTYLHGHAPPAIDRARCPPKSKVIPWTRAQSSFAVDLHSAIVRGTISVHYQPQFELQNGRASGAEALARWELPTGERISPAVFIPAAERGGMIHSLGAMILERACQTLAEWPSCALDCWSLAVNVSPLQIDEQFGEALSGILERTGVPAGRLELEITESAPLANTRRTINCLKQWKELGVRIALDDFGTGYSTLSDLCQLPVDRLKLDTSLVQGLELHGKNFAVVKSIMSLSMDLGMDVIAEGVETEAQLEMLNDLGCHHVQGYLLGRPVPARAAYATMCKSWGERLGPQRRPVDFDRERSYAC
jgi:EAL domain-containing protein (putative c-di-GMP-specific phosphodiesterase class I)